MAKGRAGHAYQYQLSSLTEVSNRSGSRAFHRAARIKAVTSHDDGEMAEWLKAHAWKACLLERVTWVRIPLSPPYSLDCREIRLPCSENRAKSLQFLNFCSETGPEKVSRFTPLASFHAFFSGGQTRSPVSNDSIR